jgi:hypothetical protein
MNVGLYIRGLKLLTLSRNVLRMNESDEAIIDSLDDSLQERNTTNTSNI